DPFLMISQALGSRSDLELEHDGRTPVRGTYGLGPLTDPLHLPPAVHLPERCGCLHACSTEGLEEQRARRETPDRGAIVPICDLPAPEDSATEIRPGQVVREAVGGLVRGKARMYRDRAREHGDEAEIDQGEGVPLARVLLTIEQDTRVQHQKGNQAERD